jgi:VWFA-related protein
MRAASGAGKETRFMRRCVAPVLLLLAAVALIAASRETHTVEVVQVPVYVTRDGTSIAGLTRDNFALYVNGKPRSFDYFDVVDFSALGGQPGAPLHEAATIDVRQRRLYVLLFDLVYSTPKGLARARIAADGYVDRAGDADAFAVGTYTARQGIQLLVPFTRDRVPVRRAIQTLKEASTKDDPLHLALAPVDRAELVEPDRFAESENVQRLIDDSSIAQLALDPARRHIRDQIEGLGELADRLAPLEGNRHVVLLTSGFDTSLLHGAGPSQTIGRGVMFGPGAQINRPMRQGSSFGMSDPGVTRAAKEMYARFTRAGVFLDCIDIEGLRPSISSNADSEGLSMLARDTGGQVVLNRNNLGEAMQTLADMQRVVYVLGFHATDTGKRENKIEVKLRGVDGVKVTYRPSYSSAVPKASTIDALRIADVLESDIPQTGVTTSIASRGKTVDVEVSARELIALGRPANAEAEMLLYVYSGRKIVAFKDKRISIDAARADATKPVHVIESFDLPPGRYVAKVLLRVDGTDALGFARTQVIVE